MKSRKKFFSRKAFTAVELLVVIGILSLFTGYVLMYSHISQNQVNLYIEEFKIAQMVSRAKSLAISTYALGDDAPCGYGLAFDYSNKSYSVFSYKTKDCSSISYIDTGDPLKYKIVNTFNLPKYILLDSCSKSNLNKLDFVFFEPPDPTTLIWVDGETKPIDNGIGNIYLSSSDCSVNLTVAVSSAGQISF